jgi:succinate dehydrogenase/fumarate reductase-like Fe-S protein
MPHCPLKTPITFSGCGDASVSVTGQRVLRTAYQAGDNRKKVNTMPVYKIYRQYKIEAESVTQATRKLIEAIDAKKDEEYHVSDSVRETDEQPTNGQLTAWASSAKKQLFGK